MEVSLADYTTTKYGWPYPAVESIESGINQMSPYKMTANHNKLSIISHEKDTTTYFEENRQTETKDACITTASGQTYLRDSRSVSTDSLTKHMKRGHLKMAKSITDICRADSNSTQRSCSFLRRCNSANSVASDALYQMINQLDKKGMTLPSKDYKILELMVARHQRSLDEMEEQMTSLDHWNKQKEREKKRKEEETIRRRQHLLTKEQTEIQLREMKRLNESIRENAETQLKKEIFLEKEERWKEQFRRQEQFRKDVIQRMKIKEFNLKAAQKEFMQMRLKKKEREEKVLALDSDYRLVSSLQSRQYIELQALLKLRRANMESKERHENQMKIIEDKFRENLSTLKEEIQSKEKQIAKNLCSQKQTRDAIRMKQVEEREIRSSRVKDILHEMERQKTEWLQEMHKTELAEHMLAEQRAQNTLTERQKSVRKERIEKMTRHRRRMNSVENEEKRQLITATESVRSKDEKCHQISIHKQQKIEQSKNIARASADLRHRLKNILEQEVLGKRLNVSDMQSNR